MVKNAIANLKLEKDQLVDEKNCYLPNIKIKTNGKYQL